MKIIFELVQVSKKINSTNLKILNSTNLKILNSTNLKKNKFN